MNDGGTWRMWFGGNNWVSGSDVDMSIMYTESSDGVNFVTAVSAYAVSGAELWPHSVVKIGSTFYVYFTYIDGLGSPGGRGPLYAAHGTTASALTSITEIASANWTHANVIEFTDNRLLAFLTRNNEGGQTYVYSIDESAPLTLGALVTSYDWSDTLYYTRRIHYQRGAQVPWRMFEVYGWTWRSRFPYREAFAGASVSASGTLGGAYAREAEIVAGGETIVLSITGDTLVEGQP
jgi:hypothetical protein